MVSCLLKKGVGLPMTLRRRVTISVIASILAAGWALPASATDLPIPSVRKVGWTAPAKKPRRHCPAPIRLAAAEWPVSLGSHPGVSYLILGVGF